MSEGRRLVPTLYPDFTDPGTIKRWDGSIEAEAWAELMEMRNTTYEHIVVKAGVGLAAAGEDAGLECVDLEGLSEDLWRITREEIAEIIDTHREEIAREVENLGYPREE